MADFGGRVCRERHVAGRSSCIMAQRADDALRVHWRPGLSAGPRLAVPWPSRRRKFGARVSVSPSHLRGDVNLVQARLLFRGARCRRRRRCLARAAAAE
eukprot:365023-Chlamydomonas_euryale.AAC.31